ncbi:MAG: endonuclease/exonuclease/phosphatase family protein [Proteobacteria bacterium]|nr:endonuclease/exonuclease/phosphatase family protein [Pseudomonadota bacterium]
MRLVTYNIQFSRGKDGRLDLARIAEAVCGADIIALQEVDRHMPRTEEIDQPARLAELLPEHFWVYGPPIDLNGSERSADGRVVNRRRQYGNMLLSRWPILSSRLHLLPKFRTFVHVGGQRGALEGVIAAPSGPLRVYSLHLSSLGAEERLAQLDYLLPRLLDLPREGGICTGPTRGPYEEVPMPESCAVMGDCNFTPQSREYTQVVGEADYYNGRAIVGHHLVDSWTHSGHGQDEGATWYDYEEKKGPDLRLDYGFVSPDLAGKIRSARIDQDAPGSDHQPYWFELDL